MSDKQIPQSEGYAARTAYRDKTVATQYDQRRFRSWRGRLGDWLDRRAFQLALGRLPYNSGVILDIPCGTGRIVSWIVEAGYKVVEADVSVEMLSVARDRSGSSRGTLGYVQADAAHLPFPNHMFVCATAIRFLGHIPAATRVDILRELARVSQGYIIVDYCVFNPIINIRRQLDYRIRGKSLGFDKSWTWQSVPKSQLESEFHAANLKAVRWFAKIPFFSDAWMVLLANRDMEMESAGPDPRVYSS